MNILGIDSSGLVASIAILQDEEIIGEYTINYKKTHSQTLLPMLDAVVKMVEMRLEDIDAIAVAAGPGSFTGLRIGSSTAKGLGLALKKPIIPVSTVEGLAYNLYETDGVICPIMDARRNQVYTGIYTYSKGQLKELWKPCAVSVDELLAELDRIGEKVIFVGDGIPVFRGKIMESLKCDCYFAPPHLARQRAGAVASLGAQYYKQGKCEQAAEHKPEYLRLSQAEREMQEKQAAKE